MGLFTVYIVQQQLTGIIDSVWKAKQDADVEAEYLNAHATELDKDFDLKWTVKKEEVQ